MVISHLAIVKHLLGFRQTSSTLTTIRFERKQGRNLWKEILDTLQSSRYLGINIVAKESGIYTRIGGNMLLIETLDDLKCIIS